MVILSIQRIGITVHAQIPWCTCRYQSSNTRQVYVDKVTLFYKPDSAKYMSWETSHKQEVSPVIHLHACITNPFNSSITLSLISYTSFYP